MLELGIQPLFGERGVISQKQLDLFSFSKLFGKLRATKLLINSCHKRKKVSLLIFRFLLGLLLLQLRVEQSVETISQAANFLL